MAHTPHGLRSSRSTAAPAKQTEALEPSYRQLYCRLVHSKARKELEMRCVVFGTGGVGKSALTIQFIKGKFVEQYDPTIEDSYRKQLDVDTQPCLLEILDTAGIDQFVALNDLYIRDGEGFVLVFSLNQKDSLHEISTLRETIMRIKDPNGMGSVPIVLVGNKADLEDEREFDKYEGDALAEKWACPYYETSARTGDQVHEVFIDVVRQIRRNDDRRPDARVRRRLRKKCAIL